MAEHPRERALDALWAGICERMDAAPGGLVDLEHEDRVVVMVWMLQAEVDNGGFPQWLLNSYGGHGDLLIPALREIGADAAAAVCERFFALLPGGRPSADYDEREHQLQEMAATLGEDAFEDTVDTLGQELYALEESIRNRLWIYCGRPAPPPA